MMRILKLNIAAAVITLLAGCQSPVSTNPWGDMAGAKTYLTETKHVMLVCIYEDYVTDDSFPKPWSILHFKATVVKTYKGDWNVSEKLAWCHNLDSHVASTTNTCSGQLMFVRTDVHTNEEFGLETGDFLRYSPEMEALFDRVFH